MTGDTVKGMPKGRPPQGKTWDGGAGCWVARNLGCCKRKAPDSHVGDENSPPRVHQRVRRASRG
eukprot:7381940-Prymnesium_polylepis.2